MKEKNQNQTKERGITLIALIVTLIILVILAAVAISAVYKTKIIEYAVNGAKDYSEEAIKENEILDKTANLLDSAVESIKDMNKNEGEENPEEEEEIDNTITDADIGKYVAYEAQTSDNTFKSKAEYSGYTTDIDYVPTEGLKWRILSKEGNKVELISETGDNSQFHLRGYQGYNNAVALLNNACNKMYVNSELGAVSARNLKIEDIEAHYTGDRAINKEDTPASKYYPEIFALEEGGSIDDNGYGSLKRSKMPKEGLNNEGYIVQTAPKQASILKGKYTYYCFTMTEDNMNKEVGKGKLYTTLFSNLNGNQWLASRCVTIGNSYAEFYIFATAGSQVTQFYLYNTDNSMRQDYCTLRPIVTIDLKNVKLEGEGSNDSPYTITKR